MTNNNQDRLTSEQRLVLEAELGDYFDFSENISSSQYRADADKKKQFFDHLVFQVNTILNRTFYTGEKSRGQPVGDEIEKLKDIEKTLCSALTKFERLDKSSKGAITEITLLNLSSSKPYDLRNYGLSLNKILNATIDAVRFKSDDFSKNHSGKFSRLLIHELDELLDLDMYVNNRIKLGEREKVLQTLYAIIQCVDQDSARKAVDRFKSSSNQGQSP